MRLNDKKFFELAKANKFEAADLYLHRSYSLSVSVFHKEVNSFTQSDSYKVIARGILNGKFGTVTTELIDKDTPEFLINSIKETATIIENDDPSIIFKGSEKYHRKNVFDKEIVGKPVKEKIDLLLEIERRLLAYDKRINKVAGIVYEEGIGEEQLSNSYGLKLKSKAASYVISAEVTAKEGEDIRTGYKVFASVKSGEFDIDKFIKDVAEDALKKLGSVQCKSKKYPVVFDPSSTAALLNSYLSNIDAEEVQKKSSLLIDKLHKQIASKKLTVFENPLLPNIYFRYFDDEGVATNKKYLVKKGELETYLYTLETASKDGVEPTGNGYRGGGKTHAGMVNVIVKPGRKSEAEVLSKIKEGVFINELNGLHAGMNAQSGNFSLQAAGFMIRDGKLAEPLSLITVAGNLVDVFMNIKDIANNSEFQLFSGVTTPSIAIKKLAISGK